MELKKVYEIMSGIKPGDKIFFNSIGACDKASQVCRSGSSAIPATGIVLKVYPRYVVVKLRGAREWSCWTALPR